MSDCSGLLLITATQKSGGLHTAAGEQGHTKSKGNRVNGDIKLIVTRLVFVDYSNIFLAGLSN